MEAIARHAHPGEHKAVQARILGYAEAVGWTFVSRDEAEQRFGFDLDLPSADGAKGRSHFFNNPLDGMVQEFNPRFLLLRERHARAIPHLHPDIYGNRGKIIEK